MEKPNALAQITRKSACSVARKGMFSRGVACERADGLVPGLASQHLAAPKSVVNPGHLAMAANLALGITLGNSALSNATLATT
jgi:hypothetical protein